MSATPAPAEAGESKLRKSMYIARFSALHLACAAVIWTGVSLEALILCAALYALRMFAVTAGYHRYFAHRTYKMGRVMQFIMAFLAETSGQKGVLWWAAHHRHHHKYSDQPEDVHSAKQEGFWYSHMGWIFSERWAETDQSRVKDLMRFPELVWLDKHHWIAPTLLGAGTYYFGELIGIGGWQAVVVGFFWSTVLALHATFTINSLSHMIGSRRYDTSDDSRNNWFLALVTFGEGWHNNHHHYQAAAKQGFFWWEYDITYYVLKAMSWVGLVSDLRAPPEHVVDDAPHPRALARQKAREESRAEASSTTLEKAKKAKDEASRWLDEIGEAAHCRYVELGGAATRKIDELSEAAHCHYVELSEGAADKVVKIKMGAESAQQIATQTVDEFARSFQQPEPKPEMG